MATIEQLTSALKNADRAGDAPAAKKFADAIRSMRGIRKQPGVGVDSSALFSSAPMDAPQSFSNQTQFGAGTERFSGDDDPNKHSALASAALGAVDSATFGFGDELAAGLRTGFGMAGDYNAELARKRETMRSAETDHPGAFIAGQVVGTVPTMAIPGGAVVRGASLGGKMMRGAALGVGYGGLYGAGAADGDLGDRAAGAVDGAVTGGIIGGLLPAAGALVRGVGKPVVNAVRARLNPAGYAAERVVDRAANQGRSIADLANRIDRAAGQGQHMTLADVGGDSLRDLARTATNVPGPARNRITAKVNIGQMAQGDRLKTAIGDLFADPNAYQATKESIIADRATAKPYYDAAYKRPVPYTVDLEEMLQTPAGKAGLAEAKANSLNRREPWAQWFASIDDNGNIIDKRRVPDTRALDEVKRVLDRMTEDAKAPADGSPFTKARATPKSIAIQSVRDDMVKFLDKENPAYAKARSVALDNIQADEALEFGRNALGTDPRVVAKRMGSFRPEQRQLAQIGAAEALRGKIDAAGYTHNSVLRIFNSRDQINGLKALFGDTGNFDRFRSMIFNEARKAKTRTAVMGNSTTARQLADMNEAGQASEMLNIGQHVAKGNVVGGTVAAMVSGLRRLGGLTPKVADEMGKLLMTSDPGKVRGIISQIKSIEAAKLTAENRATAIRGVLTRFAAGQAGRELGRQRSDLAVAR